MASDDLTPEEERIEADLLAEEVGGTPINYGSTAQAIAALTERITLLKRRMDDLTTRIREEEIVDSVASALTANLAHDLHRAEADLAHYQRQQEGRN